MAHGVEKKANVRHSYVTELLALPVAAIKHSVADGTARRWKMEAKDSGDDWDLARSATRRSEGTIGEFTSDFIEEFTIQVNETFTMLKQNSEAMNLEQRTKVLSSLTDMMAKVMKHSGGNKKLEKRTIAVEVLKLLTQFISSHHQEHAPAFVDILTAFSARIDSEFDG